MTDRAVHKAIVAVAALHLLLPVLGGAFDVAWQWVVSSPEGRGASVAINLLQLFVHLGATVALVNVLLAAWVLTSRTWRLVFVPALCGLIAASEVMLAGSLAGTWMKTTRPPPLDHVWGDVAFGIGGVLGSWETLLVGGLWLGLVGVGSWVRLMVDAPAHASQAEAVMQATRRAFVGLAWIYLLLPACGGVLDAVWQLVAFGWVPYVGLILWLFIGVVLQGMQGLVHLVSCLPMLGLALVAARDPRWVTLRPVGGMAITGLTWLVVVGMLVPQTVAVDAAYLQSGVPPLVTVTVVLLSGWEFLLLFAGYLCLLLWGRYALAKATP